MREGGESIKKRSLLKRSFWMLFAEPNILSIGTSEKNYRKMTASLKICLIIYGHPAPNQTPFHFKILPGYEGSASRGSPVELVTKGDQR